MTLDWSLFLTPENETTKPRRVMKASLLAAVPRLCRKVPSII
jgi:hypothetical protein